MNHQLIPVLVAVVDCLTSLLVVWIQLTHPLTCPYCSSQEFSPWGSYPRLWHVPYFDYDYHWRIKRFSCRSCQRTFSRYTNTQWAHTEQPPGLGLITCLFRLVTRLDLKRQKTRSTRTKSKPAGRSPTEAPIAEKQAPYLRALEFLLTYCLNEAQKRLVVALAALHQGKEGIARLHDWTGMAKKTIRRGIRELVEQTPAVHWGRPIRRPGGGRKRIDTDPKMVQGVEDLLKDETAGDPLKELKWVRKTLRKISQALADRGLQASPNTVRRMLKDQGYSLKVNAKRKAFKADHPLRNDQFNYINGLKDDCIKKGIPVISVDAKKIEYLGNFSTAGRTWRQDPHETWDHDFLDRAVGKIVPYGIYDLIRDQGYIYAGINSSTSELAVDGIVFWWKHYGSQHYPQAKKLVILSDCGGTDSCRSQLWKWDLQEKLADAFDITLEVCHYPPGTSKWNPIEHRLCSFISLNWAGRPLTSYEVALNYIRSTTTQAGLKVEAGLSEKQYPTGRQVPQQLLDTINLTSQDPAPNPAWNYCIAPRTPLTLTLRRQIQEALNAEALVKLNTQESLTKSKTKGQTPLSLLKKPNNQIYYSIKKAANKLGVCIKTLHRWEKDGKMTCHRTTGNHRRITTTEIQRMQRLMASGQW